eukprot:CAMPEP_0170495970 /NCGR_PEP_ID=MMETSP0208-20121228/19498_1 /TAXON_ID=197538 /ORGANISM="Strombidium inclinatum, Strain S3" /LENGTH=67 /DNA_ID=CAMNT_0010772387 /DNA_START=1668 /DNA_END=1871 /DNA_ORIENTATION=+
MSQSFITGPAGGANQGGAAAGGQAGAGGAGAGGNPAGGGGPYAAGNGFGGYSSDNLKYSDIEQNFKV